MRRWEKRHTLMSFDWSFDSSHAQLLCCWMSYRIIFTYTMWKSVFIVIIILLKFRNLFSHSPAFLLFLPPSARKDISRDSSDDVFSQFFKVFCCCCFVLSCCSSQKYILKTMRHNIAEKRDKTEGIRGEMQNGSLQLRQKKNARAARDAFYTQ